MRCIRLTASDCWLGFHERSSANQALACQGRQCNGLLQQAVELEPTGARLPAAQSTGKLFPIIVRVPAAEISLMRTQEPALEQRSDLVDSCQQFVAQCYGGLDHFLAIFELTQPILHRQIIVLNTSAKIHDLLHSQFQPAHRSVEDSRQTNPPDIASISLSHNQQQRHPSGSAPPLFWLRTVNEGFIDSAHDRQPITTWSRNRPQQLAHSILNDQITAKTQNPLHAESAGARLLMLQLPDGLKREFLGPLS